MRDASISIITACPKTDDLAVVVVSSFPAVGAYTPIVRRGAGIVCMLGWFYPEVAIDGLDCLEQGLTANVALNKMLTNPRGSREYPVTVLDNYGNVSAYSHPDNQAHGSHLVGDRLVVQVHGFTQDKLTYRIKKTFESAEGDIAARLMEGLRKGVPSELAVELGLRSAALVVARDPIIPYLSLRIDEHEHPLEELARLSEELKPPLERRFLKSIGEKRMASK
ncbi:MAG TPA: DUF1028 domain-containing protein [Bacillales bacterium]|nr:DUF1028 domain-containing protein [Bacillales bacterium]